MHVISNFRAKCPVIRTIFLSSDLQIFKSLPVGMCILDVQLDKLTQSSRSPGDNQADYRAVRALWLNFNYLTLLLHEKATVLHWWVI